MVLFCLCALSGAGCVPLALLIPPALNPRRPNPDGFARRFPERAKRFKRACPSNPAADARRGSDGAAGVENEKLNKHVSRGDSGDSISLPLDRWGPAGLNGVGCLQTAALKLGYLRRKPQIETKPTGNRRFVAHVV